MSTPDSHMQGTGGTVALPDRGLQSAAVAVPGREGREATSDPTAGAAKEWAAEALATLRLSAPLILTNLAQTALTATDVLMLGWLGSDALAASALGTNLYFPCLIFGIGLLVALSPMIAGERGRNRHAVREVRRTVRQGLWVAACVTVPLWLVLWQAEPILLLMRQEPVLAAAAGEYVRALMWGLLPFFGFIVMRTFLSALERPLLVLAVGAAGVVFNAAADWVLIFGHFGLPRLGLVGAGIASSLANLFMCAALVLLVTRLHPFRRYHLLGRFWRADLARFREIWRLGLPIAATLLFEVTIFNAAVFLMGLISAAALAAHAIAIQIASLTFMVPLGVSQAVTVRVGFHHGARDPEGVRRAGWCAFAMGVGFMGLAASAMVAVPHHLAGAFLDMTQPGSQAVLELAVVFLAVAALFQIADGAQAVGAGMLRGLHDTRIPMLYAGLGYWGVGLPLGAFSGFHLGLGGVGIWLGLATGLAVVAALMLGRWLRRERLGLVPRIVS